MLAAITELASVLASDIWIGAVARPKPVVGALTFVKDRFWFIGDEYNSTGCHGRGGWSVRRGATKGGWEIRAATTF